jgi:hypothetical protein
MMLFLWKVWGETQTVHFISMVDCEQLVVSDAPSIIKKLMKALETECQSCVKLKLELKTAIKIIEILKEELGIANRFCDANMNTG